ncbi:MAG TPA: peptidylprolyl isomerase [Planctomycetota bacterium]|nr:peptidylprolyl isomerase [Planctomycetota bacterium]
MSRWIAIVLCLVAARQAGAQADPIQVSKGPATAAPAGAGPLVPKALPRDGIAARVNNDIITWKDVDDTLKSIKKTDLSDDLRLSKLRKLAEERLFLQAAKANSLSVSDQELDEYVRREIRRFGNEEDFARVLRVNETTMTEYREEKRKDYLVMKLHRHLMQKAFTNPDDKSPGLLVDTVSPDELRAYYEAHKEEFKAVENITVWRVGFQYGIPRERELKARLAESFLRKLDAGTDFYIAATYYSEVRQSVETEKGWMYECAHRGLTREQALQFYAPETVTYLFDTLKEGETSTIRDDGRTLNIFRLVQRVNQREETFDDAQTRIRSILENQKREENRRILRAHLMKTAYIVPVDLFDSMK